MRGGDYGVVRGSWGILPVETQVVEDHQRNVKVRGGTDQHIGKYRGPGSGEGRGGTSSR